MSKNYLLALTLVSLNVLASASAHFSQPNIDKIRMKMPASEVERLFGVADEVESAVCGRSAKNAWVCETWKYKMPNSSEMNEFIFYVDDKGKILDHWRVKRAPVNP